MKAIPLWCTWPSQIRNPNIEIRNKSESQNPKSETTFCSFEFRISSLFRISIFGFRISVPLCSVCALHASLRRHRRGFFQCVHHLLCHTVGEFLQRGHVAVVGELEAGFLGHQQAHERAE